MEADGAVYGYYNNGKQDGGWIEKGKIAEGPPYYGGSPGEGVRFAGETHWQKLSKSVGFAEKIPGEHEKGEP